MKYMARMMSITSCLFGFLSGVSYRDAATVVGRVVSYVHKTVQQSIKEVREALQEHGKPID